jgi:hypothetical protein
VDENKIFNQRLAELLYGPGGAANYENDPTVIDNAVDAVEQQLTKTTDPSISVDGQFIKDWCWPIMKAKGQLGMQMGQPAEPLKGAQ